MGSLGSESSRCVKEMMGQFGTLFFSRGLRDFHADKAIIGCPARVDGLLTGSGNLAGQFLVGSVGYQSVR